MTGAHTGGALTVAAQDVALLDDAALEISAQLQQGLLAVADAAAIDDPSLGQRQAGGVRPAALIASSSLALKTLARALWLNR